MNLHLLIQQERERKNLWIHASSVWGLHLQPAVLRFPQTHRWRINTIKLLGDVCATSVVQCAFHGGCFSKSKPVFGVWFFFFFIILIVNFHRHIMYIYMCISVNYSFSSSKIGCLLWKFINMNKYYMTSLTYAHLWKCKLIICIYNNSNFIYLKIPKLYNNLWMFYIGMSGCIDGFCAARIKTLSLQVFDFFQVSVCF